MTKQDEFLIDLCKAYLNGEKIDRSDSVNEKQLFSLASQHNLLGVSYCALGNGFSQEFRSAARDRFFDGVYIYECQSKCAREVKDILTAAQIRHMLFKGIVLREAYPVPESRFMGDIDILIEEKNRNRVKRLLTEAGFICTEQNGPVYNYRKDGVLLEVHTRMISEFGPDAFNEPFAHAKFTSYTGIPEDNYHTAYLIAHTAHHFKFYGAGIRHVLDLAVMQKNKNIDIEQVLGILKPLKLDTFAKVLLSVCAQWFNIGKVFVNDTEKTRDYLCRCGVFGAKQENKGAVVSRREMENGKSHCAFAVKLKLAFPPYSKLKNINYIKFIDGRPWLTPYAWCYRFFYNLKNRKSFMKKTLNEIDDDETLKLAADELAYFKEIGLL